MLINVISLALGAAMIFGLTRDRATMPWGMWCAGICFAVLLVIQIGAPHDGCSTDWDGRSNPVTCE